MPGVQLDVTTQRMLLADWFEALGNKAGLKLNQHGSSEDAFTIGPPNGFHVTARWTPIPPYLSFVASDPAQQDAVDAIVPDAIERVTHADFGGIQWYSGELCETGPTFAPQSAMGQFLRRLGSQRRILGWWRLGTIVLLSFTEETQPDAPGSIPLFAPKAVVNVYIAAQGPCAGHIAGRTAHGIAEIAGAICTLALGRPVTLTPAVFPTEPENVEGLDDRRFDPEISGLARDNVSLDIFSFLSEPHNFELFQRVRAAMLTFNAALQQDNNPVACVLYVIAAESLTVPNTEWRRSKLTKRFIDFFLTLMPGDLDEMVSHGNFEEAFGIQRGSKIPRKLRMLFLDHIYDYRSGQLHEGLSPDYQGLPTSWNLKPQLRRVLLDDFAKAAITRFLESPRSSLIGHPSTGSLSGRSSE